LADGVHGANRQMAENELASEPEGHMTDPLSIGMNLIVLPRYRGKRECGGFRANPPH